MSEQFVYLSEDPFISIVRCVQCRAEAAGTAFRARVWIANHVCQSDAGADQ